MLPTARQSEVLCVSTVAIRANYVTVNISSKQTTGVVEYFESGSSTGTRVVFVVSEMGKRQQMQPVNCHVELTTGVIANTHNARYC